MKVIRVVSVACLFLFGFTVPCMGMDIRKAVIYDDSAYISYERAIHGQTAIECPPDMVPDSLTVVPMNSGTLRSVSVEPSRAVSGKAKDLQEALDMKKATLSTNRKAQAMVEKQIEIIYDSAGSKGKATSFDKSRIDEALGFIDKRVSSLSNRLVALSRKADKLELEIKDLQDQLNSVSRNPGYRIDVAADGIMEISYVIRGASWTPMYRILASPDRNKISIELTAQVRQSSSMDWDIRDLYISTGRPSYGIQSPELQPWYIYKASPLSKRTSKAMAESFDMAMASAPAQGATPQVETTATSYLIGVAKNVRLQGDGTPSTIQVRKQSLDAEFSRIAVPKYSPQAFLRAKSTLKGDMPLVAGPYSSFVDGIFSGKGGMNRIEPEQEIIIDLGIDEGIKVERKELKVFHEKTLTGKDKTIYAYAIEINNTRKNPTSVVVKDQIPISRDESITVELIKTNPEVKPDEEGALTWKIDLGPQKKEKADFSFSVTGTRLMLY
jgi:uncharacterized protein (TIGR02231 family)